jgi:hypothetical protein
LTEEAWFSKILSKINIFFYFISTIRLNRHDLWNMRFDSRTRKIVKQQEHRSNLQNPWQEWRQHFSTLLEKLTIWGQYSRPWEGKQAVFRSARGQWKMIKGWISKLRTMVFKKRYVIKEHIQIILGAMLFKDSPWSKWTLTAIKSKDVFEGHLHTFTSPHEYGC